MMLRLFAALWQCWHPLPPCCARLWINILLPAFGRALLYVRDPAGFPYSCTTSKSAWPCASPSHPQHWSHKSHQAWSEHILNKPLETATTTTRGRPSKPQAGNAVILNVRGALWTTAL